MRRIIAILLLSQLLLATQCDNDDAPRYFLNKFDVKVSPQASYNINDTIWIEGKVSAKAYDATVNDSILYTLEPFTDYVSVMKLIAPTQSGNSVAAIDKFQLINSVGSNEFLGFCPNSDMVIYTELNPAQTFYTYKIGLKATQSGDYLLKCSNIVNITNYHNEIANSYLSSDFPNQIMFNKCGYTSWQEINSVNPIYFFKVN
ncbi:MAG: hypothetical protein EOO48_07640 [Flavobacterium sp.]|nr:MAG: hypothetical protein EOO48_07640 [Flavobacterium sp.]